MTCGLPSSFTDMSKMLVVPDQQEAFISDCGSISIIFEILEYQEVPNADAAEFFFNDLSTENSALSSKVLESTLVDPGGQLAQKHTVASLKGEFEVQKSVGILERVMVRLAVVRVPEHHADILISMNEKTHETSRRAHSVEVDSASLDGIFRSMLESFQVLDYGLFA